MRGFAAKTVTEVSAVSMIALINFSPILVIGIPYENGTVAYKRDLPNGKTLYLEYLRFDEKGNKYDNKNKKLYSI